MFRFDASIARPPRPALSCWTRVATLPMALSPMTVLGLVPKPLFHSTRKRWRC